MDPEVRDDNWEWLQSDATERLKHVIALLDAMCKNSKGVSAEEMLQMKTTAKNLCKRHNRQNLNVAVMALMKSGKSTFLNSILGYNMLPVHNEPCTARICRINHKHARDSKQPLLTETCDQTVQVVAEGSADICQYLTQLNSTARGSKGRDKEPTLTITANFAALEGVAHTSSNTLVSIIDTPGPNEAGAQFLQGEIENLLSGIDAVIYLLDYTKLGTTDEQKVFQTIKNINPMLFKRLSGRLFFVLNKVDMHKFAAGWNVEECRKNIVQCVTKAVGLPDFRLRPEQVHFVSAHEALLGRLCLRGKLSPKQKEQLHQRTFPEVDPNDIEPEQYQKAADKLFAKSGMPELEQAVLTNLYSKRTSIRLLALMDDITALTKQVNACCAKCMSAISLDLKVLKTNVEEAGVPSRYQGAALFYACLADDMDAVTKMLAAGHSPYFRDWRGWTGLMEVASHGRIDIAKLLIAAKVDVNVQCWKEERTALMHAAWGGHVDMIKYLLSVGADKAIKDYKDNTAAGIAKARSHEAVVQALNC